LHTLSSSITIHGIVQDRRGLGHDSMSVNDRTLCIVLAMHRSK